MRTPGIGTVGRRPTQQHGVVLIVALIMLVLISIIVISAFNLASTNLKSVGNVQVRDEAIAAGNRVIEQQVSTSFYNSAMTQTFAVDINKDGTDDYAVAVSKPVCIRAVMASENAPSEEGLGIASASFYNTDWDIKATVSDSVSGAAVVIREGVRVQLSGDDKTTYCP